MHARKLMKTAIDHNLPLMGKGSYMSLQNEMKKVAANFLLTAPAKCVHTLQMGTNCLQ